MTRYFPLCITWLLEGYAFRMPPSPFTEQNLDLRVHFEIEFWKWCYNSRIFRFLLDVKTPNIFMLLRLRLDFSTDLGLTRHLRSLPYLGWYYSIYSIISEEYTLIIGSISFHIGVVYWWMFLLILLKLLYLPNEKLGYTTVPIVFANNK